MLTRNWKNPPIPARDYQSSLGMPQAAVLAPRPHPGEVETFLGVRGVKPINEA
jgi:hypothetical protein